MHVGSLAGNYMFQPPGRRKAGNYTPVRLSEDMTGRIIGKGDNSLHSRSVTGE